MKILFDLFPVILFFAAYRLTGDIFIATPVTMVASLVQIGFAWLWQRKVDTLLWISFVLICVLGTATMVFRNQLFIYWKPTALYWILALGLVLAKTVKKINPIKKLLSKELSLPEAIWDRLHTMWVFFFIGMGILNLLVAFYFSESTWVNFKFFGATGLTFVFIIAQSIIVSRHIKEEQK